MNINKKSWHYWFYSHSYKENHVPVSTNFCQYLKRFVLAIPYVIFLIAFAFVKNELIKPLFTLTAKAKEEYGDEIVIRLWHIMAILFVVYVYYYYTAIALIGTAVTIGSIIGEMFDSRWPIVGVPVIGYLYWHYTMVMIKFSLLIIIIIVAFVVIAHIIDSETYHIIKEYLKARKRKICPIVEFYENG